MAATAGMFIYIAAADLISELHHPHSHQRWQYAVVFFLDVALIAGLRAVVPEAH